MWQAEEVAGARVAGVGFTGEDGEKLFPGGQWVVHTADRPSRGQRRGRVAHPEHPPGPGSARPRAQGASQERWELGQSWGLESPLRSLDFLRQ